MRRLVRAAAVAWVLAMPMAAMQTMDIPIPSICDSLDPDGFWFWWWGCKPSAGGGSGGAG
jgi:hypothetical protein